MIGRWSDSRFGGQRADRHTLVTDDPSPAELGGVVDHRTFGELYRDRDRLKQFLHAMTGLSMGAHKALAAKFPWDQYETFLDVGFAEGGLPVELALTHKNLTGIGFDLAPCGRYLDEYVRSFGLDQRLHFERGDFFADPLQKPT